MDLLAPVGALQQEILPHGTIQLCSFLFLRLTKQPFGYPAVTLAHIPDHSEPDLRRPHKQVYQTCMFDGLKLQDSLCLKVCVRLCVCGGVRR